MTAWQTEFLTIGAERIRKGVATCNIIQLSSELEAEGGQTVFQEQLQSLHILLILNAKSFIYFFPGFLELRKVLPQLGLLCRDMNFRGLCMLFCPGGTAGSSANVHIDVPCSFRDDERAYYLFPQQQS